MFFKVGPCQGEFRLLTLAGGCHIWLWIKDRYPAWDPDKWRHGLKPAVHMLVEFCPVSMRKITGNMTTDELAVSRTLILAFALFILFCGFGHGIKAYKAVPLASVPPVPRFLGAGGPNLHAPPKQKHGKGEKRGKMGLTATGCFWGLNGQCSARAAGRRARGYLTFR